MKESAIQINRLGKEVHFESNQNVIQQIIQFKNTLQDKFPKIGIFVICYQAEKHIEKTLSRIPAQLLPIIEEVFIFDDASSDQTILKAQEFAQKSHFRSKFTFTKNSKNMGYGGNQKMGYRYGLSKNLDTIIMLHGDGQYAPEFLGDLILPTLTENAQVVFGSRMLTKRNAIAGGMPVYKLLGNQVLTWFENFILGTNLSEFHSGYRLYSTKALRAIPFEENSNDFHFDTQIIIQCRALNTKIFEVPIQAFYGDEECRVNGLKYAKDVCLAVLEYRLHQLHLLRCSRYLLNHEINYSRKRSPFSSHEIILSLLDKPGRALDLGSSSGFLTQSLLDKNVSSVCVDIVPPECVNSPCEKYLQINLENPQDLKFNKEFDYVIFADVIEHIRSAKELLNNSAEFLKENGTIIVSVPNIAIWFYRLSLLVGRFNYGPKGTLDETHIRFYTLTTIKQLLVRSGYTISSVHGTGLPFEVVFQSVGKSRLLKFLDTVYYQFVKLWPALFAYQFVIKATPSLIPIKK